MSIKATLQVKETLTVSLESSYEVSLLPKKTKIFPVSKPDCSLNADGFKDSQLVLHSPLSQVFFFSPSYFLFSKKHHSLLSLFSLSLFGLFASSTRTTSTKYLSKPNTFLSTITDLCGSVQPDLDTPFQSHCIEQGIETNSGHNKEESIENRTQKKMSKGNLQSFTSWVISEPSDQVRKTIPNATMSIFTIGAKHTKINSGKHVGMIMFQQAISGLHYPPQANQ